MTAKASKTGKTAPHKREHRKKAAEVKPRILMTLYSEYISVEGVGTSSSAFRTWPSTLSLALQ